MYLLAILFPPAAVLMCGKPFQAVIAFVLMLFGFVPGVIWALVVVADFKANQRNDALIGAVRAGGRGSRPGRSRRDDDEGEPAGDNPFDFGS